MLMTTRTISQMPWSMASLSKRQIIAPVSSHKFICSSSEKKPRKLILYSKPGCCLCDGLKEKLFVAFSPSSPTDSLDIDLEIRDITSNSDWERAYEYEIPVLAKIRADGAEEKLPRLSPRVGIEVIRQKIGDAFKE